MFIIKRLDFRLGACLEKLGALLGFGVFLVFFFFLMYELIKRFSTVLLIIFYVAGGPLIDWKNLDPRGKKNAFFFCFFLFLASFAFRFFIFN